MINGKRSQLAMEREAAHNTPFISLVLRRAEMVKGMTWHGLHSPRESDSHFLKILSEYEEILMFDTERS